MSVGRRIAGQERHFRCCIRQEAVVIYELLAARNVEADVRGFQARQRVSCDAGHRRLGDLRAV